MKNKFENQFTLLSTRPGVGTITQLCEDFKAKFGDESEIHEIRVLQVFKSEIVEYIKDIKEKANKNNKPILVVFSEICDTEMLDFSVSELVKAGVPENIFIAFVAYDNFLSIK